MKFESLSLKYDGRSLSILDQQRLPHEEVWLDATQPMQLIEQIKSLKVRGAPMIGVAAALSLACYTQAGASEEDFFTAAKSLREARPTAVNLMYAIDKILQIAETDYAPEKISKMAESIFSADVHLCEAISVHGLSVIREGDQILTHCNTGGLATAGTGTAIGVIRKAHEQGFGIHVYVDETRPLNQGGRLTAWELQKLQIPYTLITDSMAGFLMSQNKVDKILVGADRIACNGDFANKIGTYSLAVLAKHHEVPFYVAAPFTSFDIHCEQGSMIPIEERDPNEVRSTWAPKDSTVYNPAFDVTPAGLVTGWITDKGIFNLEQIKQGALLKLVEEGS